MNDMSEYAYFFVEYIIKHKIELESIENDDAAVINIEEIGSNDINLCITFFNIIFNRLGMNLIADKLDKNKIKIERGI